MGLSGFVTAVAAGLGLLGLPATVSNAADQSTASRMQLLVIAGEKATRAEPGSRCLTSQTTPPGSGTVFRCTSVKYDPTPRRLFRVSSGSTVAMCAGSPASRMTVATIRDSKRGPRQLSSHRALRLDKSGECWRVRLPKRLAKATSLDIRVDYNQTDFVRFTAGIAVRR